MVEMLDLTRITSSTRTLVLTGKERGESARAEMHLDRMDNIDGTVEVKIPATVDAITPSFVLGMFGESVVRCGTVDRFLDKYRFDGKPHVVAQIRRGAEYSLITGSALS